MVTTKAIGTAFEEIENAVCNEGAAQRQDITIGMPMLMGAEEPRRLRAQAPPAEPLHSGLALRGNTGQFPLSH